MNKPRKERVSGKDVQQAKENIPLPTNSNIATVHEALTKINTPQLHGYSLKTERSEVRLNLPAFCPIRQGRSKIWCRRKQTCKECIAMNVDGNVK